jgi:hypothetical protein
LWRHPAVWFSSTKKQSTFTNTVKLSKSGLCHYTKETRMTYCCSAASAR